MRSVRRNQLSWFYPMSLPLKDISWKPHPVRRLFESQIKLGPINVFSIQPSLGQRTKSVFLSDLRCGSGFCLSREHPGNVSLLQECNRVINIACERDSTV